MPGFKPRLKQHASSRGAGFKRDGIAQNPLDARDVGWRIWSTRNGVSVGVDADRRIAAEVPPAQRFIEDYPGCRVDRRSYARRNYGDIRSEPAKRFHQRPSADVASAAAADVPRDSGYETKKIHE